jgi:general secretion pathway protein G
MSVHQRPHREVPPSIGSALRQAPSRRRCRGFTLFETLCASALVGLLAAVAIPGYRNIVEKQKVQQCVHELAQIALAIERYRTTHRYALPESLGDLPGGPFVDPWGNAYEYLNFDSDVKGIKGKIRKDHNLHPLNSDMDLYSKGPDGASVSPLTAKASRDDVIWARDGGFIGSASDF